MSSIYTSHSFQNFTKDYENIVKICSAGLKIPPISGKDASLLLHSLLSQVSEESFQDITQLITTEFRPVMLSESSTSSWRSGQLPNHFREFGLNHPHNMFYLTSIIPAHFGQLQQVISYMFIQLILNNQVYDLPSECHVVDVVALIENNGGKLKKSWTKLDSDEQLYSCWSLLQLLDILVLGVSGSNNPGNFLSKT